MRNDLARCSAALSWSTLGLESFVELFDPAPKQSVLGFGLVRWPFGNWVDNDSNEYEIGEVRVCTARV